ncbi:MAG: hypothetical protein RQ751_14170, partial [Longimicrobiales bacterium]|nr:hypothetical protein [Longimicrobiales bacterium]
PRISLENQQITWRDRRGLIFHLESGGGETTVRIRVARPLIRRGRMGRWIAAAADRLEAILRLVAGREPVRALGSGDAPS